MELKRIALGAAGGSTLLEAKARAAGLIGETNGATGRWEDLPLLAAEDRLAHVAATHVAAVLFVLFAALLAALACYFGNKGRQARISAWWKGLRRQAPGARARQRMGAADVARVTGIIAAFGLIAAVSQSGHGCALDGAIGGVLEGAALVAAGAAALIFIENEDWPRPVTTAANVGACLCFAAAFVWIVFGTLGRAGCM